jgi:hypothetical protein
LRPCPLSNDWSCSRHCGLNAAQQGGPELTYAQLQLVDQRLKLFLTDRGIGLDADAVLADIEQPQ